MNTISDILKTEVFSKPPIPRKIFSDTSCPGLKFRSLMVEAASQHMYRTEESVLIDEDNREVLNQLFYYFNGSLKFNGDLNKGILLIGAVGSGKTVLMRAFIDTVYRLTGKQIEEKHSKEIIDVVLNRYDGYYKSKPLYIDDIGKESVEVMRYGEIHTPMIDLFNYRYDNDGLTFGTSNQTLDDMPYPLHTLDRIQQMFNIIVLPSRSRRN